MKQSTALSLLKLGKNIFITGSAGTGKTYLLRQYIQYLKERQVYPTIVAPTGIAASHLKGQTIHSFFSLGIRDTVVDNSYIEFLLGKNYLKSRFKKLKVLIIDEISMVSPEIFSSMNKILQAFKATPEPFGGVQVVISGDFFQLPPVSREPKEKRFAWQAPVWRNLELNSCYLEEKFRQDDNQLIFLLDSIRSGTITDKVHDLLSSRWHKELDINFTPTRLYTHNVDVDRINLEEINRLEAKPYIFTYTSKGSKRNIEKIFKTALILEELTLKKGAVVIFIKNNPEKGYVNGTTGVVIGFDKQTPIVKTTEGKKIWVLPEDWTIENESSETIATVSQTPLRLAWAITIHKSQGMTLDAAEIDLGKTFEVGQGYVALSRIKNIEGLRLIGLNSMALRVDPLILRIDEPIKRASQKSSEEIDNYTEEALEKDYLHYMRMLGGLTNFGHIENEKEQLLMVELSMPLDNPTYLKTKALIKRCDSVREIAKSRSMAISTIWNHFATLKKEDKSINLKKFKPTGKKAKEIERAIRRLKKKKKPEDFKEDGGLKLKPIFDELKQKVSYDKIREVIFFMPQ
jgi:hypothetical protein